MVAENKQIGLVVRIGPKNGQDSLTVEELQEILDLEGSGSGSSRFFVQRVEGGSLDGEILAQTVRQVLKDNIYGPLTEDITAKLVEIDNAWQEVKDKVEPLLQGKYATCPVCGQHALSAPLTDGVKFICPHCETKCRWKFIEDKEHADGGRYTLEK